MIAISIFPEMVNIHPRRQRFYRIIIVAEDGPNRVVLTIPPMGFCSRWHPSRQSRGIVSVCLIGLCTLVGRSRRGCPSTLAPLWGWRFQNLSSEARLLFTSLLSLPSLLSSLGESLSPTFPGIGCKGFEAGLTVIAVCLGDEFRQPLDVGLYAEAEVVVTRNRVHCCLQAQCVL